MTQDLDQSVLAALNARRGEWPRVAIAAQVSYSWLSKFANGHIDNPGYRTLKRLETALAPVVAAQTPPAEQATVQA